MFEYWRVFVNTFIWSPVALLYSTFVNMLELMNGKIISIFDWEVSFTNQMWTSFASAHCEQTGFIQCALLREGVNILSCINSAPRQIRRPLVRINYQGGGRLHVCHSLLLQSFKYNVLLLKVKGRGWGLGIVLHGRVEVGAV